MKHQLEFHFGSEKQPPNEVTRSAPGRGARHHPKDSSEISKKLAAEIPRAAQFAYGGHPADAFMDRVFAEARRLRALREAREARRN